MIVMKCILPAILSFFVFFPSVTTYAEENFWDRPPHPSGAYGYDESLPDLLNIKGLTYHKARPQIIKAGWTPLQTLQEGTEDHTIQSRRSINHHSCFRA
jgi:hypothetical protein